MNTKVIRIDSRMSDLISSQLSEFQKIQQQLEKLSYPCSVKFDLLDLNFVYPCFILPLCCLAQKLLAKQCEVTFDFQETYLSTIGFPNGINPQTDTKWLEKIESYKNKTYLPIIQFPAKKNNDATKIRRSFLDSVYNLLRHNLNLSASVFSAIAYLLSEMTDNIIDHACVENGWFFAQYYPTKGYLDVIIADNGVSIYGSYQKNNKQYIKDHKSALEKALQGESTKHETGRGFGIRTTRSMLVEGMKGKFLILSGNALFVNEENEESIIQMPTIWQGTILIMRIPDKDNIPTDFNYHKYTQ